MGTVVLGEVLRVKVYCQDAEQGSDNVLHYRVTGVTGLSASYQDVANVFSAYIAVDMIALLANVATYRGVGVQSVSAAIVEAEKFSNAGTGIGVAGAVGLPRQTAGLLKFTTGLAGRANQGRSFVPFPAADDNRLEGQPTAGYVTRLSALGLLYTTPLLVNGAGGTATISLVVYHRGDPDAVPPVPPSSTLVTDYGAPDVWSTQRRRGVKGRPNLSPI